MLLLSFRVSFKKLAAVSAAATLVILTVIYGILLRPFGAGGKSGSTEEQRIAFLQASGWEIDPESGLADEVLIPGSFDRVFTSYNDVQLAQGYDLRNYAGKRVKRYSYLVTNYPENQTDIRANLLVYNGIIVGGDVYNMENGGFLTGISEKQP